MSDFGYLFCITLLGLSVLMQLAMAIWEIIDWFRNR